MTASTYPQQEKLSPEEIASCDGISGLKLSVDGLHVVYSAGPRYKSGGNKTAAIWLAETQKEHSARKLTSGAFYDRAPAFHPVSSDIYFLSDRRKPGGSAQVYSMPMATVEGVKPTAVIELEELFGVNAFSISPNGKYLAFIMQKKSSSNDSKEPIAVWREKEDVYSLCLIDLQGAFKDVTTLVSVDSYVESFTWKPDSSSIAYRLLSHPDFESRAFPVTESIISIDTREVLSSYQYPVLPKSPSTWLSDGTLAFVQSKASPRFCSSSSLWTRASDGKSAPKHVAYGMEDDAGDIVYLGAQDFFAISAVTGITTKIDVYNTEQKAFTAFQTVENSCRLWDMKITDDRYVMVAVLSSSVRGEAENIWSGFAAKGSPITLGTKLSTHDSWFINTKSPMTSTMEWSSSDGETIQGVYSYPRGADLQKMPTVIVPHGGPYGFDNFSLSLAMTEPWRLFLATHGYLAFSPNYRGSMGRGDAFAAAAQGGMGTLEWDDIETMIAEAVRRGMVDPKRIAIAGYSQGGFLTAWGCTRPNNTFKAGVVGAGVTDWGILAATSDAPDFEAALAGGAPWDGGEPAYLRGSPLKDARHVSAPLLFLHGREDKRVPVSQAIALLRGVERVGQASVKPELVIYPGEDHTFEEREHVADTLRRLLAHIDKYL